MLSVAAPPLAAGDNLFLSHRNPPPLPTFIPTRPKTLTTTFTVRSSSSSSTHQILDAKPPPPPPSLFPPIKVAKRVVLVRHGQSTWNEEGRIQGSSNFSVLTPKGESQAETSRQMLIDDSFDVCFSSPLTRAKRTAEVIWGSRKEEIITDSDLREIDLYSFQGLLKREGKEKFGAAFSQWQKDAPNFNIDGHYPVRELWSRARSCWNKILVHESRSVLVVAHNAVNQALVATAIGLETEYFRYLLQSNCGVSVLDFIPPPEGGSPFTCLNRLNQTPHSPLAGGSSGGRKASKQLILVCHGSSVKDSESQKTAELLLDLRLKAIVSSPTTASIEAANTIARAQEFADSLGADCVPRCVEAKLFRELDVEDILRKSKKDSNIGPSSPGCGWLNGLEIELLTTLWEQSGRAWKSLVNELSDDDDGSGTENVVVVAVAHPAVHIALLGHCLSLKREMLRSFHLDAGSISVVDFPDGSVVVRCINYTAHLGRQSVPITTDTGR